MKKLGVALVAFICFFTIGTVKANTLNSINTTVDIDENGNGHVTEVWDIDIDEGTETYHSFGNMTDRSITNFKVSMDGKEYTNISSWNVNASRADKAYKNGINKTKDGLELCWGIEYGHHVYTVNYTVNNLVWQYDNNQILYFSFLPQNMKQAPKKFSLTVKADKELNDVKYSSYGFNSNNSIENGTVKFESKGSMNSNEYVVLLIGFPKDMFNLAVTKTGNYDDVASEAVKGASLNEDDSNFILPLIIFFGIMGIIIGSVAATSRKQDRYDETNFVIPKEVNNFRDIPFNKSIMEAYFIGERQGIIKKENLMGAFLLKWIKENRITMVPTEGGKLDFNKNDNYYIDLTNIGTFDDLTETELSEFMISAAKEDRHLTPKEFKKWCTSNYTKINTWLESAKARSKQLLIANGYIIKSEEKYSKTKTRTVYVLTEKLQDETIKLKGLKQFLDDMTLIDDKKAIEVHIWDEYLIFAQMFGIADKVAKQFKEFHPVEYSQGEYFYSNVFWISHFSMMSTNAAMTAMSAASSGGSFSGGGFSSGGFSGGGGGVR